MEALLLRLKELKKMSEKITFEQKLARLEEIVRLIENEDTPIEQSIELYAEAAKLAAECNKTLNQAELTLKEIKVENNDK